MSTVGMTDLAIVFTVSCACGSSARGSVLDMLVVVGIWTPASTPKARPIGVVQRKPTRGFKNHESIVSASGDREVRQDDDPCRGGHVLVASAHADEKCPAEREYTRVARE